MPDWFYRTVSRPLLYRLGPRRARALALGFMGRLARLPLGGRVIDLLGHMRADPRLAVAALGVEFPSPVGLGPGLDVTAAALPALARFGVGFLTVGPIAADDPPHPPGVERDDGREAIGFTGGPPLGLRTALPRLAEAVRLGVPLVVRVAPRDAAEARDLAAAVAPFARVVAADAEVPAVVAAAGGVPVLVAVAADLPAEKAGPAVAAGLAGGAAGVLVTGEVTRAAGGVEIGGPARGPALALVRGLRERFGPDLPVIAGGGVHEADDALALRGAGADLVAVDSGLVFNGPGLVKRANDAVLYRKVAGARPPAPPRPAEMTWFWTALMGVGMLIGSVLALVIAATRVVLPYDEAFLGMTRDQLAAVNPRLLAFMAHDRVSLAGTMVSVGVLYVGLSVGGVRRGVHWAMVAVFASAFAGFASFFLFLGFGYLDVLHAFVTACLLQLLLLGVHAKLGPYAPDAPQLRTDRAWRRAQWGQLLLVLHGAAVVAAGLVISAVGVTSVFVHEDLEFMGTTAEALAAASPRLVPLVAHDRATFGGMLVATGLALVLAALWGFRAGNGWLWWAFLAAVAAGYVPAIGVHFVVGYDDWFHLLPAGAGFAAALLGLGLSRAYLCRPAAALRAEWGFRSAPGEPGA
ncbi:MAG: dihydroorotate dehydrogenase [Isosphaera sp.]|nr:dihydroorotate dehydrogenase [Isosphaera sp.]